MAQKYKTARALLSVIETAPAPIDGTYTHANNVGLYRKRWKDNEHIRLTAEQLNFFDKNGSDFERSILEHTVLLNTSVITQYVQSFDDTFFSVKGAKSCDSMSCGLMDFHVSNESLVKFWKKSYSSRRKSFCHVPVRTGQGKGKHLVGVTIDIPKRKLCVYNPNRRYTRKSDVDDQEIAMVEFIRRNNSQQEMGDGFRFNNVATPQAIIKLYKAIIEIQRGLNREQHNVGQKWRLEIINSFIQQDNAIECGIFVCFFFECISRGVNVNLGKRNARQMQLGHRRQWIAFSLCVARIQCAGKHGTRGATVTLEGGEGPKRKRVLPKDGADGKRSSPRESSTKGEGEQQHQQSRRAIDVDAVDGKKSALQSIINFLTSFEKEHKTKSISEDELASTISTLESSIPLPELQLIQGHQNIIKNACLGISFYMAMTHLIDGIQGTDDAMQEQVCNAIEMGEDRVHKIAALRVERRILCSDALDSILKEMGCSFACIEADILRQCAILDGLRRCFSVGSGNVDSRGRAAASECLCICIPTHANANAMQCILIAQFIF